MDLIVDQVETEAQIVELLDCKLKYGQGNLFSRPRLVEVDPAEDAAASSRAPKAKASRAPEPEPAPQPAPQPLRRALSKSA